MTTAPVLPALFISHGSPMILAEPSPARDFLSSLAGECPRPRAIVAISAHWDTGIAAVSSVDRPKTIHDFYGFPQDLYALTYNAPGAPDVAAQAMVLLAAAGIKAEERQDWGLDHGAWIPLLLAWPQADIPVAQLSIQMSHSPAQHFAQGQALRSLREQGVLILGSGAATHNLRAYFAGGADAMAKTRRFSDWMAQAVIEGRTADLLDYRRLAPDAAHAHPSPDHILPLFTALGAGTPGVAGRILHRSLDGNLSMDAYAFD